MSQLSKGSSENWAIKHCMVVYSGSNTDYKSSEPLKALVMLCYITSSFWNRLEKIYVKVGSSAVFLCLCMLVLSRAVRRRHGAGGGAPVNFGRRRRAPGLKKLAAAAVRSGVGAQNFFPKVSEKISFYPQNFL